MRIANYQFDELLTKVNESDDIVLELKNTLNVPYVRQYLETQISETWPKFDVDSEKLEKSTYHRSMAGAFLLSRPVYTVFDQILMSQALPDELQLKRLKNLYPMLCAGEADILIALLEKNISAIYPNITYEVLNEAL